MSHKSIPLQCMLRVKTTENQQVFLHFSSHYTFGIVDTWWNLPTSYRPFWKCTTLSHRTPSKSICRCFQIISSYSSFFLISDSRSWFEKNNMYNNMQKQTAKIHLSFWTVFIAEDGCVTALSGNKNETCSHKRIYLMRYSCRWMKVGEFNFKK